MITKIKKQNIDDKLVSYEMTLNDGTIISVPLVEGNRHYQEIQEWVAKGNTIEEAD